MRSRPVTLVAVVIAAAAVIFAVSRFVSSPGPEAPSTSLPTAPASYLGVYEKGPHCYLPAGNGFHQRSGRAAEPRRVLQWLGGAVPDLVRGDRPPARRGHDPPVGSHPSPGRGDRRWPLRRLSALFCRRRTRFRPPGRHRLRARNERLLVFVGLRASPAPDVRGRLAAHRYAVSPAGAAMSPGCGPCRPTRQVPGRSPPGGRVHSTSPGSASTATTTRRLRRSSAFSARRLLRCGPLPVPVLLSEVSVGPGGRPSPENRRPVRRDAAIRHARARVVRHRPAPGSLPSGLAHRRQSCCSSGLPARRLYADLGSSLTDAGGSARWLSNP